MDWRGEYCSGTLSERWLLDDGTPGLRRAAPYLGLEQFRPAGALGSAAGCQRLVGGG